MRKAFGLACILMSLLLCFGYLVWMYVDISDLFTDNPDVTKFRIFTVNELVQDRMGAFVLGATVGTVFFFGLILLEDWQKQKEKEKGRN